MKRKGNIYNEMISMENLHLAYLRARKNKSKQKGVIEFEVDLEPNLQALHEELKNKTYRTSAYKHFIIKDPKVRKISSLPFRDRVVHHLIMIPLEGLFVSTFTSDTYSCIKGRGIHAAKDALTKHIRSVSGTIFCLKMDVKQFYPSIDHDILKWLIRRKIKDQDLLKLLDEIIDSAPGVPIGNYLSQYFANFYLCYLDHVIKEVFGVRRYCRYADDMIIVDSDIKYLHAIRALIEEYLWCELKLELKGNYQVFPVSQYSGRAIDFVGYPQYPTHIKLRPSIKRRFAKMMTGTPNRESIASYVGWAKPADTKNLLKKLLNDGNNQIIQSAGGEIKKPDR
jgi:RNA-directed DNA polymerase